MDDKFLQPEVRCDFLVTEERKRVWAIQIELLEELKRICDKHNIRFWAEGGTLLGTIRHKGFVPWDDDIDVQMLREDYNRFIEIAKTEVKSPYFFACCKHDPRFIYQFSRLQRDGTTMVVNNVLFSQGFHQGIFIDIFPLDFVTPNYEKDLESIRNYMIIAFNELRKPNSTLLKKVVDEEFDHLSNLPKAEYGETFSLCQNTEGTRRKISDTYDLIELPFEYTTIPVMKTYKTSLDLQYPNWETVFLKGGQRHRVGYLSTEIDSRDYRIQKPQP